jgi:hypothetical protein
MNGYLTANRSARTLCLSAGSGIARHLKPSCRIHVRTNALNETLRGRRFPLTASAPTPPTRRWIRLAIHRLRQ